MTSAVDFTDLSLPLAGAALLVAPLAVLAPLGIAPLAGVAALLILLQRGLLLRQWPVIDRISLSLLGLFAAWACASALWSLLPDRSLVSALRVGAICLGGLVLIAAARQLDPSQRQKVGIALAAGTILGGALMAIDLLSGFALHRLFVDALPPKPVSVLNRAATVVAILCWPVALLAGRRWQAVGCTGVFAVAIALLVGTEPVVPLIAVAVGFAVFLFALLSARRAAIALCAGLVVVALLIPAMPGSAPRLDSTLTELGFNENSISHRLGIWAFSADHIIERPVTGWGFDSVRALPGGQQNLLIRGLPHDDAPALPLHPHNATVQIWLETGLPGLLIALILVCRGVLAVPRSAADPIEAAILLATGAAAATIANLSYGIWQGWWLCLIWLSLSLTVAIARRPTPAA